MSAKVSAIVPVFNRPHMVVEAVQSLIDQTYRPLEIIVVDDGSNDSTPEVIEQLRQQHREVIRTARQENAGPGAARNRGLQLASGEFVQYLDSDDLLHPEKLERQVSALLSAPDAGVCYCETLRRSGDTEEMSAWARTAESIENIFPSFLPKRGWATLTPLWRRRVCDAIGPWKPYRVMEDWEHDLRAGILGTKIIRVSETLCTVRDHAEHRASGMNEGLTKDRMQDFFRAHESIWNLMKEHRLTDWNYLESFSRTMFWIARMCGERGLNSEAESALNYSDEMTTLHRLPSATRRFRQLKMLLGWKSSAWLVERVAKRRRVSREKRA